LALAHQDRHALIGFTRSKRDHNGGAPVPGGGEVQMVGVRLVTLVSHVRRPDSKRAVGVAFAIHHGLLHAERR